jgi:hypothetical protein
MRQDTLAWFDGILLSRLESLDDVSELRQAITDVHQRDPIVVAAGDFNNGKSMLLNALLGRRPLGSSPVPTTGCVRSGGRGRGSGCACGTVRSEETAVRTRVSVSCRGVRRCLRFPTSVSMKPDSWRA